MKEPGGREKVPRSGKDLEMGEIDYRAEELGFRQEMQKSRKT